MPPKGRGRGRGGPPQDGQQQQGRPGGQQGRQGGQQQQGRQGGQHQQGGQQQPYGRAPPGMQQQPAHRPEPVAQPKIEKKVKTITPEEIGFHFEQKMALTTPLPPKPGVGKSGMRIKLISNCYSVDVPSGDVYHYDVEIMSRGRSMTTQPVPDAAAESTGKDKKDKETKKYRCMSTKRNREVINAMLSANSNFRNMFAAYDGRKNLYTRKPLDIHGELKCEVVMDDENPGNPGDPRGPRTDNFQVIVKPVQKKETNSCAISLDPLHALFQGQVNTVPQDAIMALETVLRHGPCLQYFPVGRSFFYPPLPRDIHPLGGGKEIWFGYHQSLRLGQWKPMVNLDVTATTFYRKGPVLEYIAEMIGMRVGELNQNTILRDSDIAKISKEMKNMRIEVTHLRNYKRKYRILKFTRESANNLSFNITVNGQEVRTTVARYFAQHYQPLRYPNLPCIQGNPEAKRVFLPVEVCDVVEGQHSKKKLDDRQNAEMIKFTAKPPKSRFNEISDLLRRAGYDRDPFLKEFGIKVSREPLQLEGRVLDAPNVRYDNEQRVKPRDGQWDMRNKRYFKGADIRYWVLLSFANPRFCDNRALDKFARMLCDIAGEQGITMKRPEAIEIIDSRRSNVHSVLVKMQQHYKADLAVVVVPAMNKAIYGEVKQAAETILGLVTQCIRDESVSRKCTPPLVSNLCQKINAKMGGINNSLTPGETPQILRKPVIIIGADVTHPGPSQDIKPSIAAAVGSLDSHPSRYAVTIRAQTNIDEKKQSIEVIMDLKNMVLDLLRAFYQNTGGKKPEKIIFYRDGVSEGQFDKVRSHEVRCIREACRTLNPEYQPGITFIVVQKRHHTRFNVQDERQGVGKMKNIPPGTTVDTVVNHPLNFDFFLCSHNGLQGTSRPAHYTVIEDDNEFSADDLQKLTYYLCHTYVRCTKSISCPAPVMYAHLAAFRARQHLLTTQDESSASSTTSGSSTYHPLPEAVKKAIEVKDNLKNTMYFV